MLETDKWKRAKEIFQAAIELPASKQIEFVDLESHGDAQIRSEVESLLAAHEEAGTFIASPALAISDFVEDDSLSSDYGRQIGAYKIIREIGRGGMGAVYLAERATEDFTKRVALKLIKRGLDTDEIVRRFRNERQILANLEHPHIARLVDGGATDDGLPYLVMEYVEGLPLTRFCHEKNLDLTERLDLILKICSVVQYAHRNLVVHRDLKPSNILVTDDRTPKLLDFGIAKLLTPTADFATNQTATNLNVMTPEYASPEQVRGQSVTTATDVYSLGVIMYEVLTGSRPYHFDSRSLEEIARTICEIEPVRPSAACDSERRAARSNLEDIKAISKRTLPDSKLLRGDLDNIVLMAMRKEPERRYSSVEQFAEDIRRYLNNLPVIAQTDSLSYRASKFVRRNRLLVGAGAGITLSLVAGIVATARQSRIARLERDHAERNRERAMRINTFLKKMLSSADPRFGGKDAKIVEILGRASDDIEKDFSSEPEIVADLRTTIGLTYLNLGQIDAAARHLRSALEIRLALFGDENHESAVSLNNYGKLLQAEGDLKGAEKLYRQSLSILRLAHDEDGLDVANVLGNLGYLLMLEAKYEEAKDVHGEELQILRRCWGDSHPDVARTLGNLANIYSVVGDKRSAEPMHRQALDITQTFYHGQHPDVALAMLHLGITLASLDMNEAEVLFRESLALRRQFFGDAHTETAWSLYYLGDILLRKKQYERAAGCAREILSHRMRSIPETHSVISSTLLMLARCFLGGGKAEDALPLVKDCLKLREDTLPAEHWIIATTKGYLADCYVQMGWLADAVPLLEGSYRALLAKLGPDHEHTELAKERIRKYLAVSGRDS